MSAAVCTFFGLLAPPAWADPSRQDELRAQALFDDARALMDRGEHAAACPKLAESQRLDPGGGTLLNLALCHEAEGKLGTAYAELEAARAQASRDGRKDREALAESHLAALRPRVPRLAVEVSNRPLGLDVAVDGTPLGTPSLGVPTRVDPGVHVVEARAPGHDPVRLELRLDEAETRTVTIPRLVRTAAVAPSPDARPAEPASARAEANPWHSAAIVSAAVGAGAVTVAGVGWVISTLQRRDACVEERSYCSEAGLGALGRERVFGAVVVGGAVATLVGLAGMVALPPTIAVSAAPERGGASAAVRVTF